MQLIHENEEIYINMIIGPMRVILDHKITKQNNNDNNNNNDISGAYLSTKLEITKVETLPEQM